jgi:hypothetical protein
MAVKINIVGFWVKIPCILVCIYQHVGGTHCFHGVMKPDDLNMYPFDTPEDQKTMSKNVYHSSCLSSLSCSGGIRKTARNLYEERLQMDPSYSEWTDEAMHSLR